MSRLSPEDLARKIVATCDPARADDTDHLVDTLVGAGVCAADVDLHRWLEIKAAVRALLPARLAAEALTTRDRGEVVAALVLLVGVTAAVGLAVLA